MGATELAALLHGCRIIYPYAKSPTAAEMKLAVSMWVDALEGVPQPFTGEAFRHWIKHGKDVPPVPVNIIERAIANMTSARKRISMEQVQPPPLPEPTTLSQEQRKEISDRVMSIYSRNPSRRKHHREDKT